MVLSLQRKVIKVNTWSASALCIWESDLVFTVPADGLALADWKVTPAFLKKSLNINVPLSFFVHMKTSF